VWITLLMGLSQVNLGSVVLTKRVGASAYYGYGVAVDKYMVMISVGYWQVRRVFDYEVTSYKCEFSDLWGGVALKKKIAPFVIGVGIGMHTLKNYVEQTTSYPGWKIIEYYAINKFTVGGFATCELRLTDRVGIGLSWHYLLLPEPYMHLFFGTGNISYAMIVIFLTIK